MRSEKTNAITTTLFRWAVAAKALALHLILFCSTATALIATPFSVPPSDAPELAAIGNMPVGWKTITLTNPDQPDIPKMVKTFGIASKTDRTLKVEIWYPARAAENSMRVQYQATLPRAKSQDKKADFSYPGIAIKDAPPLSGKQYPLVLVSHGFGGWGTFMTYLTENLASKGYVVAAIDHADAPFTDGGGFALSFGSTIVHRARDQQFVLEQLLAMAKVGGAESVGGIIDAQSIGVIGYSMGGFGALATAGAGYDPASPTFKQIPAKLISPFAEGDAKFIQSRLKAIKALVLIAPWGGQPANRAWSAKSLQSIQTPALFIVGDQDDIVDYRQGVAHLFDNLKSASRHMLVYQSARHNTGGNPAPVEAHGDFVSREYFDEPVWRKDRLNAINQHFVTAFLDRHLKGMTERSGFLDLPMIKSEEGKWTMPFGQSAGGAFAAGTGDTAGYWRGFQRRWAMGLEMHRKKIGE